MSPAETLAVLAAAVTLGALVQGAVGLGLGTAAAPVTTLVGPDLMPGVLLWLAALYPVITLLHEGRHADWEHLRWAFAGRLPGTVVGGPPLARVYQHETGPRLRETLATYFLRRTRAAVPVVCDGSAVALVVRNLSGWL